MTDKTTRRTFLSQATAISAGALLPNPAKAEDKPSAKPGSASASRRVLGANDRINFAFIGMGGRMGAHTRYLASRQKEVGDVQAVAICEIYEKRKQRGQEQTGVDSKNIHHDYRELCARKDIDAVVIATPDHWHARQSIEALTQGKHVYLEKPMTYTIEEARDLARKVHETKLVLQVGSQHLSVLQYWKAREAVEQGLIGKVLWASTSYSRNVPGGEWNYKIDPPEEANEQTIDWKAFLGYAKKRPFDKDRYFRWRKYWDYSGGIATDLFYHRLAPMMTAINQVEFPTRVTAGGGIFAPQENDIREVPDTYYTTIEYPGKCAVMVGSSMLNEQGIPEMIRGTKGSIYLQGRSIRIVPERPFKKDFVAKHGKDELVIETGADPKTTYEFQGKPWTAQHMENFINAMRGKEEVHFPVDHGYKAMVAIRLGVDAYRSGQTMYFDAARERATTRPLALA
jgi:predicted dehydrogenase